MTTSEMEQEIYRMTINYETKKGYKNAPDNCVSKLIFEAFKKETAEERESEFKRLMKEKYEECLKYHYNRLIEEEVPYIDIKEYSHNIINGYLGGILNKLGLDEYNKTIEKFDLEEKGWRKIKMIEEPEGDWNNKDTFIKIANENVIRI